MAKDKKGRDLSKGIQQRGKSYEARPTINGTRYYIKGRNVTEVKNAVEELRYKVKHGLFVKKEDVIFSEWFDTWLNEYKKNQVKDGTLHNYQKYYDAVLEKRFGKQKISDIRGEHIQKLYNDMVADGYAVTTIKVVSAVLHGMFKQAVMNELIEKNPVEGTAIPKEKKEKEPPMVLTKEQQKTFMEYAEKRNSYLYNLFAVMLRTGMRGGEARGLRYSDIDKEKNVIHIERTLKRYEGKGFTTDTPKTKSSKRDIPMRKDILALLEDQNKFWGFKIERIDRFLFCNELGEALSRERVQGEIDRIIRAINADEEAQAKKENRAAVIFPRFTSHCFRHTFATRAVEGGMAPEKLQKILGHKSLSITMDLYYHAMPDELENAMEAIAGMF